MKIKVFEQENSRLLENEVNGFLSLKNIEIINIQYSSSGLAPDAENGWSTTLIHCAMVTYKDKSTLPPPPLGPRVRY